MLLKRPVDEWSDILVFVITQKLDTSTLKEWKMNLGSSNTYPSFQMFIEFLFTRVRARDATQSAKNVNVDKNKIYKQNVKSYVSNSNLKCLLCKEAHHLRNCNQFKEWPIEKRKRISFTLSLLF